MRTRWIFGSLAKDYRNRMSRRGSSNSFGLSISRFRLRLELCCGFIDLGFVLGGFS